MWFWVVFRKEWEIICSCHDHNTWQQCEHRKWPQYLTTIEFLQRLNVDLQSLHFLQKNFKYCWDLHFIGPPHKSSFCIAQILGWTKNNICLGNCWYSTMHLSPLLSLNSSFRWQLCIDSQFQSLDLKENSTNSFCFLDPWLSFRFNLV